MPAARGRGTTTRRIIVALGLGGMFLLSLLIVNWTYRVYSQSEKPELHPVALFLLPASPVERGQQVKVSAKIINTGAIGADAFKVSFFYRPLQGESRNWTGFAAQLLPGLAPSDQPTELTVTLDTAAPQLGPGGFQIRVLVDAEGQIPEQDETNNELITGLTIVPSRLGQPDLHPATLTLTPPSPVTGEQTIALASKIVNSGTRDATAFSVSFGFCRLSPSRSVCSSDEFQPIPADPRTSAFSALVQGGSLTASAELSIKDLGLTPGTYQIRVLVDPPTADRPQGQVNEQDESNNDLITGLDVQGAELHPIGLRLDKPFVRLGDQVNLLVKVENSGNATARDFETVFYINGKEFARTSATLAGGSSAELSGRLNTGDPTLGLTSDLANKIQIVVDPNQRISELDETNNTLETGLTLQAALPRLAELHPIAIRLNRPSPLERGRDRSVTISAVIENSGSQAAKAFDVELAYRPSVGVRWIPLQPQFCSVCRGLSLAPGTTVTVQGSLALEELGLAPGIYDIRVLVDPQNQVPELDETNNQMSTTLTLLSPRKPNLILSDLKLDLSGGIARRGQIVRVLGTVVNQGDHAAGPFSVQFSRCRVEALPGVQNPASLPCTSGFQAFDSQQIAALAIGEQAELVGRLDTTNFAPGTYLIQVSVDPATPGAPDGAVLESNESDNSGITTLLIAGPDLIVQGLKLSIEFAPSNLLLAPTPTIQMTQGEQAKITAQIANIGLEDAGAFLVRFSLCPLGTIGQAAQHQNCVPFGSQQFTGLGRTLPQPAQASASLDSSAIAPGLYDILVEADPPTSSRPSGQVAEQLENNNSQSLLQSVFKPLEILPPPDLIPTSLALNPPGPTLPGAQLELFVQVENQGTGPALRPFITRFSLRRLTPLPKGASGPSGEQNFDERTLPGLGAGERAAVKGILDTSALPFGSYELCATLDPTDAEHPRGHIPESNEANNRICTPSDRPLQLGPLEPDLRPLTIGLSPAAKVNRGQPVKVQVTLTNAGTQPAGPFRVDFLIRRSDIAGDVFAPFGRVTFSGLGVGESTQAQATLQTAFRASGSYEIVVIIDAGDQVKESDEHNNRITATLQLR